jgi:hypothetical protein
LDSQASLRIQQPERYTAGLKKDAFRVSVRSRQQSIGLHPDDSGFKRPNRSGRFHGDTHFRDLDLGAGADYEKRRQNAAAN